MPKADCRELGLLLAGALIAAACAGVGGPADTAAAPAAVPAWAPARTEPDCPATRVTRAQARALVDRYCVSCHSPDGAAGADYDFRSDAAIDARHRNIEAKLGSRAMPPPEALQPTEAERAALRCWAQP